MKMIGSVISQVYMSKRKQQGPMQYSCASRLSSVTEDDGIRAQITSGCAAAPAVFEKAFTGLAVQVHWHILKISWQ